MKKEKHKYKNLKIRPLQFSNRWYQLHFDNNNLNYEVLVDVVFNKPNWYLLNNECWIEVLINNKIVAFKSNKESFLYTLNENDLYCIPTKDIELLKQLQIQNPKLLSGNQHIILSKVKLLNECKGLYRRGRIRVKRFLENKQKNY